MIKSKQNSLFYLCFSYSIFDFATTILKSEIYTFEWVVSVLISTILSLIIANIIRINLNENKMLDIVLITYSFKVIISYIFRFSNYIEKTHSQNSILSLFFLTGIIMIYLFKFHKESIDRISPILLFITLVMLLMVFLLNYNKIQTVNLYTQEKNLLLNTNAIKIYEWIIPLIFLYKKEKNNDFKINKFIIFNGFLLVFISVFSGLAIRGDVLYSYSPLHSLFLVTRGVTIQRFDYVLTIFLVVCFFSMILLNIALINKIYSKNNKMKPQYLFILLITAFLISLIQNNLMNFYIILTILFIIVIKKRRA